MNNNNFVNMGLIIVVLYFSSVFVNAADVPSSAESYRLQGIEYEKAHNNTQALAAYNKGLKFYPNVGLLYWNRGLLFFHTKNYGQAIADLTKYIGFKPNSKVAILLRGCAYYNNNQDAQAVSDFQQVIKFNDCESYFAYLNLATVYEKEKSFLQAFNNVNKAEEQPTYCRSDSTGFLQLKPLNEIIIGLRKLK